MRNYQPRKTEFRELLELEGWAVKVYTITNRKRFGSHATLQSAIARLPEWLEKPGALGFETYGTAFLIVHEGTDGVWTLINCWVEGEILQSMTFHTNFGSPNEFQATPGSVFLACVWEMAVITFERAMWIEHILRKATEPDFKTYLGRTLRNEG